METTPLLEAKEISKTFFRPKKFSIFNSLNLKVYPNDSIAIIGRSGEGKSTLLHILGTLEKPTKGSLYFNGEKLNFFNASRIRRTQISFVFQSYHLLDDYSVLDNVLMPAKILRKNFSKGSPVYNRAFELLELVGLKERAFFYPKLLSGGEKQRVAIARSFCNDPDLILADEPSGNLDLETAKTIHNLLIDYSKRPNKALIVVTHHPELASLCGKKLFLEKGQLLLQHE